MENVAYDIRSRIVSNKYRTSLNDTVRVCFYARVWDYHPSKTPQAAIAQKNAK